MSFSDTQTRQLKAKLDAQYVKTRKVDNATLHYIEGWHAIAEANRIFGHDAWDRKTLMARCVWTGMSGKKYHAVYTAKFAFAFALVKLRSSVRAQARAKAAR